MRFSIVTPVYNAGRYLEEMLESVRRQSFTDWELRIVDDGSSDNSSRIIAEAAGKDSRIKPLFLGMNSGSCFEPRRKAIETSEGEYVVNIDADDTVEPDYLMKFDRKIAETKANLIYADMYLWDGGDSYDKFVPKSDSLYEEVFTGKSIFSMALDEWEVSGVAAFSRVLALQSLELYDGEMASDSRWNSFDNENLSRLDLFLAEKVAFSNARYHYRQVPDSVTHKASEKRFAILSSDILLNRFTASRFGSGSEENILAQRQMFHHLIEAIRLRNRESQFRKSPEISSLLQDTFNSINFKLLKGRVSPRYRSLLRMGLPVATTFLRFYEGR